MTKIIPFTQSKVGLVLVGGGAKGAYHVGALRYLAELDFMPDIIAGTSIGVLNGAIIAESPDLNCAVQRLQKLWKNIGNSRILSVKDSAALRVANYGAKVFLPHLRQWLSTLQVKEQVENEHHTVFDPEPIEQFIRQAIDIDELRQGRDLWVTVFPSLQIPFLDYGLLLDLVRAKTGTSAQWLRAQDYPNDEELLNLLLASAAIPLAFPHREVNGQPYIDGALADNVPIKPLIDQECTHIIVIHLQNASVWDRTQFPEQTIIEIRPQQKINPLDVPIVGRVNALLDFSASRIAILQEAGYVDAKNAIEPILKTLQTARSQTQAQTSLIESTQNLIDDLPI